MKIEILGMGCAKCKQLYDNVQRALERTGREAEVVKVEDIAKITGYDVMIIPALVVDGEVRSAGKVLSAEEIAGIIQKTGV
ncbi:MAG: TM0996/MTH895 family glutaredoxin-like protein [Candidatus Aureabacteria bacterium]|nr:TM0996/MTH895 family glutaredoxin-like protein [Candidatus Auribacterota bacterium]